MGNLKETADKAIKEAKEVVAKIVGESKPLDDGKVEQRKSDEEKPDEKKNESVVLNPLGNLNRLT
jgi:hypothetical protein